MIRHIKLCSRLCSSLSKPSVFLPERTRQLKLLPVRTYARDKSVTSQKCDELKQKSQVQADVDVSRLVEHQSVCKTDVCEDVGRKYSATKEQRDHRTLNNPSRLAEHESVCKKDVCEDVGVKNTGRKEPRDQRTLNSRSDGDPSRLAEHESVFKKDVCEDVGVKNTGRKEPRDQRTLNSRSDGDPSRVAEHESVFKKDVCEDVSVRNTGTEEPRNEKTLNNPGGEGEKCGKSSSEYDSGTPGGRGGKRRLLGILAIAGGVLAYLLWPNDTEDKGSKGGNKITRRGGERSTRIAEKFPSTSADLPKKVHYLLVGGGTSSFSAFRSIKSLDPKAEVLVIASEPEFPYMRPPLSKEMWASDEKGMENLMFRQWNGSVRSVFFEPDSFYMEPKGLASSSKGGVAVARGWTVKCIDALSKQVTLDDGSIIAYEKCLLAPGSKPKPLPLLEKVGPGVQNKVFYFRDVADFKELAKVTGNCCEIVVIGGGFLGSELACSLTHYGCKVTQVFRESGLLLKLLPKYLSKWLTEQVRGEGVNVLSESEVVGMEVVGKRLHLTLSNGKKIEADYCAVATGAVANTDLAESSKLETHPTLGGYLVNPEMLARSNLYVAGDAACFYDERFGRRRVEHHDHAVVSGRLAGENMVGAGKPYLHVSMLWSDLSPDLGWEGVGILDPTLKTTGVFSTDKNAEPGTNENFNKGVIFYQKDDIIVGILLWNVFNRMQLARQILKQGCKYDDLNEVAKLFSIHSE